MDADMATEHYRLLIIAATTISAMSASAYGGTDESSQTAVNGYGTVEIGFAGNSNTATANNSDIVALSTTVQVPHKPRNTGTVFMWPGLQPFGANFKPIDNGVLQPVLSWGTSCAPGNQPKAYSTWWISAQYVNKYTQAAHFKDCHGGPIMDVSPGDHLTIKMDLSGTIWRQTVSDTESGKVVGFDKDLQGQSQNYAYFKIEPYQARSIPVVTFSNTTIAFSRPDSGNCDLRMKGAEDIVSIPLSVNGGRQCAIGEITLKPAPDSPACPQAAVAKAQNEATPVVVTFTNRHGAKVSLFWLNHVGAREAFAVIKDGETYTQNTYLTHPWLVMDQFNRCIDLFVPEDGSQERTFHYDIH